MSGLRDLPRRSGGLNPPVYDGGAALLRGGGLRLHLTVPAAAPEDAGALVYEQDTCGVLAQHGGVRDTRASYQRLVAAMLAQRPAEPGDVIVRGRGGLRLYAVVHDLETDPSWREIWIRAALDEILRIARARGLRSLVMPPLGAVHGRLAPARFVTLLQEAFAARPLPALRHLWLLADLPKLAELHAALAR
ncbi:MAG: hypothetical protein IT495_00605 [Gammaproteobacteria bacterium]|nr:hypothetical protein [Gammaproteobacteria bacterium]